MSLAISAFNSAATEGIAAAFADRRDAQRAIPSTAERAFAEREPKPAEFSCSPIMNPVAHAAPAK
jgi:hypothetical protein